MTPAERKAQFERTNPDQPWTDSSGRSGTWPTGSTGTGLPYDPTRTGSPYYGQTGTPSPYGSPIGSPSTGMVYPSTDQYSQHSGVFPTGQTPVSSPVVTPTIMPMLITETSPSPMPMLVPTTPTTGTLQPTASILQWLGRAFGLYF